MSHNTQFSSRSARVLATLLASGALVAAGAAGAAGAEAAPHHMAPSHGEAKSVMSRHVRLGPAVFSKVNDRPGRACIAKKASDGMIGQGRGGGGYP